MDSTQQTTHKPVYSNQETGWTGQEIWWAWYSLDRKTRAWYQHYSHNAVGVTMFSCHWESPTTFMGGNIGRATEEDASEVVKSIYCQFLVQNNDWEEPADMPVMVAHELLKRNGFKDITVEYNKAMDYELHAVFEDPSGIGIHMADSDLEICELAFDLPLNPKQRVSL